MRLMVLAFLIAGIGILPAQPVVNGNFEFPNQLPATAPVAPWLNSGASQIGPHSFIAPNLNDDGFPTSGAQWLYCTNLGLGSAAAAAPSGGGLHAAGTVGQVAQTFTADGTGGLSFDWTWITSEIPPDPTYNDFASIDILDMAGNNIANLLFVDTGINPHNIPGATGGPAGPATFGPSGSLFGGNEVLPVGPKTAVYVGLPLPAGVQFQLVLVAGNLFDNAFESFLYVDNFVPSAPPAALSNQPNLPQANLTFTGTACSPPGVIPEVLAVSSGYTTMTVGSGPNGDQPYALFWTPGFPAIMGPGIPTPLGIADFSIPGYGVLAAVIDGFFGLNPTDQLLGTTTPAAARSISFGIGSGAPGTPQATYQALVADPTSPAGSQITQATQINYAFGSGPIPPAPPPPCQLPNPVTWPGTGDDDVFQLVFTPPLVIPFYGVLYSDLYVGSNGDITFGAGDTLFFPTDFDMLNGPPRVAGLWTDLNPGFAGAVNYLEGANSVSVSFEGVTEFGTTNVNDFCFQLFGTGALTPGLVSVLLGQIDATPDILVGISPGGIDPATTLPWSPAGVATGASLDLSNQAIGVGYVGAPTEAIYELFPFGSLFDLGWPNGYPQIDPCTGLPLSTPVPVPTIINYSPNPTMGVLGDTGYTGF